MDYSVTDLMVDMGWISILMLVGSLARRYIGWFRALLIPAPITAGMLGLLLGPNVLDIIPFSEQLNGYTTLAIAIVFAALPFTMQLRENAKSWPGHVFLFRRCINAAMGRFHRLRHYSFRAAL